MNETMSGTFMGGAMGMAVAPPQRARRINWAARLQSLYSELPFMATTLTALNTIAVAALVMIGPTALFATLLPYILSLLWLSPKDHFRAVMVYFAYFSVEGMYKYASHFSQAVYVIAPLALILIQLNWFSSTVRSGRRIGSPPGTMPLLIFVIIAFLASFNPLAGGGAVEIVAGFVTAYLWYAGPALLYFVTFGSVRSTKSVLLFFYVTILVSTVVSAVAILQLSMGQHWTWDHFPGVQFTLQASGSTYRPPSTTAVGAGGCQWARYGVVLPMGLLGTGYVRPARRTLLFAAIIINIICLVISGVRLLAFQSVFDIVTFVLLTAKTRQHAMRTLAYCIVGGGIAIYLAGLLTGGKVAERYTETLQNPLAQFQKERGQNVTGFLQYAIVYPFGQGYSRGLGNWQDVSSGEGDSGGSDIGRVGFGAIRDTAFGALTQDVGIPGLLAAFIGIGVMIYQGFLSYRNLKTRHIRSLGAALFGLMAGLLPGTFAGPVLQAASYFWIVAGLLMILPKIEAREYLEPRQAGAEPSQPPRRITPSVQRRREREARLPESEGPEGAAAGGATP